MQKAGAQHGRQDQGHEGRHRDRRRHRDRELTEQPPDDAAHEQQWDEHGDERHADRQHGEADLARALQRRLERLHAVLDVPVDVLHHHDGVIDHETHRDGERHQRDVVEAEAAEIHDGERPEQRQRHDQPGDHGDAHIAQEQQNDQHHQQRR